MLNSQLVDRILRIEDRYLRIVFELAILILTVMFLVIALDYRALYPFAMGIPLLVLLLASLALHISPRLRDRFRGSMFNITEQFDSFSEFALDQDDETDSKTGRIIVLKSVAWICILFAALLIFGFGYGSLVFLLLHYHIYTDTSLPRTVGYSVFFYAFIVIVFEIILTVPFPNGILGLPSIETLLLG